MPLQFQHIVDQVDRLCSQIEKSPPTERLLVRQKFYKQHTSSWLNPYGYGRAEVDFVKWKLSRGVFDAQHDGGSCWWKSMNMQIIRDSELALALFKANIRLADWSNSVNAWLKYFEQPSAMTWYCAHNLSLIVAYQNNLEIIQRESPEERKFIHEVLKRVFFAQALTEGKVKFMVILGRLVANPSSPFIRLILDNSQLYPSNYPLLANQEYSIERRLLKGFIGDSVSYYPLC